MPLDPTKPIGQQVSGLIQEQSFPELVEKAKLVLHASKDAPVSGQESLVGPKIEKDFSSDPVVDPVTYEPPPAAPSVAGAGVPVVDVTAQQHAEIFLGFLHDQIANHGWLGPNAQITTVNKLDKGAGIDSILMLQPADNSSPPEFVGLKVFFRGYKVSETFAFIREKIENDTLTPITTFRVEGQHIRVPQIIIGASNVHRQEALNLWAANQQAAFVVHPMQYLLLAELRLQLEAFASYANRLHVTDTATRYSRALETVNEFYRGLFNASDIEKGNFYMGQDDVMWQIVVGLIRIFEYEGEDFARFFRGH